MKWTPTGLVAGLLLGIAAAIGGFGAFVATLLLGALGLLVGRYLDGTLDLDDLVARSRSGGPGPWGRR
jgi:uncharacterized membrane protein